ncbi:glucose/sucrose specific PTS system IIB component domain protein, partial [Chlamydia psittaci 02DC14]
TNKIIKLEFKDKELVNIEKIKAFKQITGITLQSKSISLVMGNICPYLNDLINKEIKK